MREDLTDKYIEKELNIVMMSTLNGSSDASRHAIKSWAKMLITRARNEAAAIASKNAEFYEQIEMPNIYQSMWERGARIVARQIEAEIRGLIEKYEGKSNETN